MTFKEIYQEKKEQPTPAQIFIQDIAEATCREESTVRQWLSGTQAPSERAQKSIAKHLNLSVEELFPPEEQFNVG